MIWRIKECPECGGPSVFYGVDPDRYYKFHCCMCYKTWRTMEKEEKLFDYYGELDEYLLRNRKQLKMEEC